MLKINILFVFRILSVRTFSNLIV